MKADVVKPGRELDAMEDLAPLAQEKRTWRWHTFIILWVAMTVQGGTYSFGSSLVALGLRPKEAMACAAIGSAVTAIALVINAIPSTKYGIPFPVYCRAAFGVQGAKYAALTRGIVAIFWQSFGSWLAADVLFRGCTALYPELANSPWLWEPYVSFGQFVCLVMVACLQASLLSIGINRFATLAYVLAPLAFAFFALVAIWLVCPSWGGVGLQQILDVEISGEESDAMGSGILSWIGGIDATINVWSTLLLNIADLSRFAPSQSHQAVGQVVGFPLPQLFMYCVGILGAAAIQVKTGTASWQLADLFGYWAPWAAFLGGVVTMVSLVSVNITANLVSAANDLMNLNPTRFTWRWCAYTSIIVSVGICPFYLFHSASSLTLRFVGGYGIVTGALYGCMTADYFIVRRRHFAMDDLYPENEGEGACAYWHGHNWRAMAAIAAGIALPLCAWLQSFVGIEPLSVFWLVWLRSSWFTACAVAAVVYVCACLLAPPPPMSGKCSRTCPKITADPESSC